MKLIYHPPLRHTSLGKYRDFVLYRRNFLKKVKCLNLEVSNFSKQLLFGQGVFCRKTIRRTIKSKQSTKSPSYELLRVAETDYIICLQKIRELQGMLRKAHTTDTIERWEKKNVSWYHKIILKSYGV